MMYTEERTKNAVWMRHLYGIAWEIFMNFATSD